MKTSLPGLNWNARHFGMTPRVYGRSMLMLFLCSFSFLTSAQNKIWHKTFGGNLNEQLTAAQPTTDGGYILGGTSFSGKSGDKSEPSRDTKQNESEQGDYWIVKLKADGSKAWDKTFGGTSRDVLGTILQTSDGGFILGGTSFSGKSGDKSEDSWGDESNFTAGDFWIVKLNADGSKAWDKTIGSKNSDYFATLYQTQDGGYILGGTSYSDKGGDKSEGAKGFDDYWVVKLDAKGAKQWDKTIGSSSFDYLTSVQQTKDGGYILGGNSSGTISGDKSENPRGGTDDYWIIKLNSNGKKVWDKTSGGNRNDLLQSIQQTADNGYILGGTSDSRKTGEKSEENKGNDDLWIVKLNADGSKAWD
ncbi:MAG: hypothetical protein M3142_05165, partial [Bacteroidota bacterium]|nr:hypothetical protein [Bacteroidota bacterium]